MEYWLISIPGDKTPDAAYRKLEQELSQTKLCNTHKFNVPDLKVGTLDSLVALSDELSKLDVFVEQVVNKLAQCLSDCMESAAQQHIQENLKAGDKRLPLFMENFHWDSAKYRVTLPLKDLVAMINRHVVSIDADLKTKWVQYSNVRNNLQTLYRKQTGPLLTKSLHDIVKKEHFVLGSEYLVTLLVVVNRNFLEDWWAKYATLTDYVVPNSSELIHSDQDASLVTVTLFEKVVDTFKVKCRENRFIVRDFQYNERELAQSKTEIQKNENEKTKIQQPLLVWLRVNFGEIFTDWMHVKALKLFVESVLRYGLPVNFQGVLIAPAKKTQKKLRDNLQSMYAHLDSNGFDPTSVGDSGFTPDFAGLGVNQEYYPYVYLNVKFDYPGAKP